MTYNFDEIIDRRSTACVKWDTLSDELYRSPSGRTVIPMWVADMDFRTAPAVIEAVKRRVEHGVFGYTHVPPTYYEAVCSWFSRRHGVNFRPEWIIYTSGVVPAISATLKALCPVGTKVLVQTPVYNCFFSSIRNDGLTCLANPLTYTPLPDGSFTYQIDWDDFERCCADPDVRVFLLCNPHNPAGRVWTREELLHMGEICLRHGVVVLADEIHCELVQPGHTFTPFASLSDDFMQHSVTLCSPTKAFNIAGLQIANIICADADRRAQIDRAINVNEVCDVNSLGVVALMAAYGEGGDWLDQLNAYLAGNYEALKAFFATRLPALPVARLEGTYLVWVDIRPLGVDSTTLFKRLLREAQVYVNRGAMYDTEAGEGFIRLNIALPRQRMLEALERIAACVG